MKNTWRWWLGGIGVFLIGFIWWWSAIRLAIPQSERDKPTNTIMPTDWYLGNPQGQIKIIEYSDFQCPACQQYSKVDQQLVQLFGDRIGFAYRHFPLRELHRYANLAAQAAEAAGKQGKFWDMAALLFNHQNDWADSPQAPTLFTNYAESLKLNLPEFLADIRSRQVRALVEADYINGLVNKINSTPTFYINGQKINNLKNPEDLISRVNFILQEATASGNK